MKSFLVFEMNGGLLLQSATGIRTLNFFVDLVTIAGVTKAVSEFPGYESWIRYRA
jgi:hypothetical protein